MKRRTFAWSAAVTTCVVAITGGLACRVKTFSHSTADLSPIIDDLLLAIDQDAVAAKYDELASPDFRRVIPVEQFVKTGSDVKARLGALRSKKLLDGRFRQEGDREFADVAYEGTFDRGVGVIKATFVQDNGRWLLHGFLVSSPHFKPDEPGK